MRITFNDQEYRLFFRYKWEQPGGASRANGKMELRHATWYEILPERVRDKQFVSANTPEFDTIWQGELWRTTEAVLAKVLPSQADGARPQYEEVAKGIARCSPLDKFDKEVGRLESLRRLQDALRTQGFTGAQLGDLHRVYAETRPEWLAKQAARALRSADPVAAYRRRELGI